MANSAMMALSTKEQILSRYNEQQKAAIIHYQGACVVIAGPGSGKTSVTVGRIAYMIADGIKPDNILAFTFTRKAANELKERVSNYIGSAAAAVTVGTYHSFCSKLLRKYVHYLGFKSNFSVYDEDDKQKVLKEIVTDDDHLKPSLVANYISRWKNNMMTPAMALQDATNNFEKKSAHYYKIYQQKMKELNAFDFDDLIYYTIRLLENHYDAKNEICSRYKYIISDEFQDSNFRDVHLIRLLGDKLKNICIVLDDSQSIYAFRGAKIEAVYNFINELKAKQFILGQNYRSTQTVVEASNSVIANNVNQMQKTLFTANKKGAEIIQFSLPTAKDEALHIIKLIKSLKRKKNFTNKDFAILYRMSYLSRQLEEAFLKNGIAYNIVGGTPFYARKEIKDIMAYLRFANNLRDEQAFKRIINTPKRGIGEKSLIAIIDYANKLNTDTMLLEACKRTELKGAAKKNLQQFVVIIEEILHMIKNNSSPMSIVEVIIERTQYKQYISQTEPEAQERLCNIDELLQIAYQYDTVNDFIYNIALNETDTLDNDEKQQDKVNMLTMHAAKGLEFPVVIILSTNEGIIPHWKADTTEEIYEERRLFYVAMTRAEKLLFITRPKVTALNGMVVASRPSRFIGEISSEYISKVDV